MFHLKPVFLGMMFVAILLWGTTLQAAVPTNWKASGFSIDATNMTLRSVLDEFGRVYGVRVELSANGAQVMRSRLKADNGTDFLDRLGQLGNFRWFVYGETLYIVPAGDNISLRIDVGEDAVQDAKAALVGLGLYDERFGWGELPDTGTIIVSGPRAYVNLARDLLLPNAEKEKEKIEQKSKRIMMFRLKYASATDRTINSRGRPETIPGVKTMLTSLLFGPTANSSPEKLADTPSKFDLNSRKPSRSGKVDAGGSRELTKSAAGSSFVPLFSPPSTTSGSLGAIARQKEDSSSTSTGTDDTSTTASSGSVRDSKEKGSDEKPRIEANPSLNAIMIYDSGTKRAMYAALIAELDVQPQQVEIEALIIDIDRSLIAEMGVEWGVTAGAVNGVINSTAADSLGTALPVSAATLLISNAARFYARLKALESKGDAHILATPTVLTLDNVAAVLDLSQTAYVSLIGERVADLADITAGTMLRVIPRIIHDGGETRVHLEVDIEDGSLSNPSTSSSSSNVNVTRSTISTQAIIDLQQTLMIGGYHAESLNVNRQKVPLLGDIPVVGGLFRSESQTRSTKERLFLITPRISGNNLAKATPTSRASERARAVIERRELQNLRDPVPETEPLRPASTGTPVTSKYSTSLAEVPQRTAAPAAVTVAVPTPVTELEPADQAKPASAALSKPAIASPMPAASSAARAAAAARMASAPRPVATAPVKAAPLVTSVADSYIAPVATTVLRPAAAAVPAPAPASPPPPVAALVPVARISPLASMESSVIQPQSTYSGAGSAASELAEMESSVGLQSQRGNSR
ncbi:MAG: type III secretion system outer membrane ring subunit SctC [Janthinobacterium lividum]